MTDMIRLTGIRADGTHGVLDFEHTRPQPFVVDAVLYVDMTRAGRSDDLNDTVNYGLVAERIVDIIHGPHVDLIERLAERIADAILAEHALVETVDVTVHKPKAPISVPFEDVAVEIVRHRADQTAGQDNGQEASGMSDSSCAASPHTHHAVIALGGNVGDVEATLRAAIADIDGFDGTQVTGVSPLVRTAPWGMAEGTPDFRNAVIEVSTTLTSSALLARLHDVEAAHGRTRTAHWASRTLDLDIIDYDHTVSDDPALTLPHPRAWQRAFVLAPWHALDPDARLVGRHGGAVADLLAQAPDRNDVRDTNAHWMTDASQSCAPRETVDSSQPVFRKAVISMNSTSTDAEALFRSAIAALDGVPGTQVDGISPLYHVSAVDGPDAMAAVVQLTTNLRAPELVGLLAGIAQSTPVAAQRSANPSQSASQSALQSASAEPRIDLHLVDMEGVTSDDPECRIPWPEARKLASVLAPWLDMDPSAVLGGDPVAFLLAMAPDAERVGLLSDHWIIGGAL